MYYDFFFKGMYYDIFARQKYLSYKIDVFHYFLPFNNKRKRNNVFYILRGRKNIFYPWKEI